MDDEELAKYPGLQLRKNGKWYVHKRVPTDLKHVDPRFQVRLSLDTSDLKTAIQRYPFKLAEIITGFDKKRAELRERGAIAAAMARGKLEELARQQIEQLVANWWEGRGVCRNPELDGDDDPSEIAAGYDNDAAQAKEDAPILADRLLVEAGMAAYPHKVGRMQTATLYPAVNHTSPAYKTLVDLVSRALRIEAHMAKDHVLGTADAPFDPIFNPLGVRTPDSVAVLRTRTVRDLILAYREERVALYGEESTDRKYKLLFEVMEDVWGPHLPVGSINRERCIDFVTFVKKVPPNKTKRFPKLTFSEAVAHAEKASLSGLAPQTVASYFQNLRAVLRWAEKQGWLGHLHLDRIITKRDRKSKVKRRRFNEGELSVLFDALAGFRESEPTKFWVPAIALYTGARLGEICQLHAADVVPVDGVWCLDLSEFDEEGRRVENKSLKNEESERFVPIHSQLIDAGFLEFKEARKGERLFRDLTPGPKGNYSHEFSKWFGRYKKKVGLNIPALVFHSFRHGFRDACDRANLTDRTAHALGGWASVNQGAKYGNRNDVAVLHPAIQKISFWDFRLPARKEQGSVGVSLEEPQILQPVATAAE